MARVVPGLVMQAHLKNYFLVFIGMYYFNIFNKNLFKMKGTYINIHLLNE